MRTRFGASALILALLCIALSDPRGVVYAQSLPRLFEDGQPGKRPKDKPIKPHQARKAKLRLEALDADALVLNLFDNAERTARKTKVEHPRDGRQIWHGVTDDGGLVTFAVVEGKASGTVYLDGRSFEITADDDGEYTVEELNGAAFPQDVDPMAPDQAPDVAGDSSEAPLASMAADGVTEIDVMVVWTPAMRTAVGGTAAAAESLVLSAIANANTAYANSGVNARLRLVYSGEVSFGEGNISTDLTSLSSQTDGRLDEVHALRSQYGADVVTLLGSGYAAAGACGVGYLMQTVTAGFASNAFNIVDQSCAAGYLSYAHEVGHNQGIHHDPANASSNPSYPYAYGYQDPGNVFRTVMSYGGATRVPFFSSPSLTYNGRVTGTSSQDNARALSNNIATVAAFRNAGGSQPPPPCSYSLSPTSLSFGSGAGTATVSVTTTSGCTWTSSSNSAWMTVSGSGTGSGTATVNVVANSGASRSVTVVVAGVNVTVSQAAAPPPPTCTYSVSPTSLSFGSGAGSATVSVSTTSGCSWTSSGGSWTTVSGSGTGSGTATVNVVANSGASRNATVIVAGVSVAVTQAAAPPPPPSCTYSVSPTSLSFTSSGGTATVTVTTTSTCAWTSSSSQSWAAVSGARTGSGTATVTVSSTTGGARSATLTIAGKSVSVSQSAAPKGKKGGGNKR